MRSKEDFLKRLRSDPLFQSALKAAKTPEERRRVIAITEAFVGQFAEVLAPMIQKAESDPSYRDLLRRSLVAGEEVVTDQETAASGSQG